MATKVDGLSCVCGNSTVCKCVVDVEGTNVNQLHCCECGIIMRSPAELDTDGKWLENHWRSIHMERERYKKNTCWTCWWWKKSYLCTNPESSYFRCECSSKFGCQDWYAKEAE